MARHAFLKEQLGRLHARVRVEALHHPVAGGRARDRPERHPLVMREVDRHDRALRPVVPDRFRQATVELVGPAPRVGPSVTNLCSAMRSGPPFVLPGPGNTTKTESPYELYEIAVCGKVIRRSGAPVPMSRVANIPGSSRAGGSAGWPAARTTAGSGAWTCRPR